MTFSTGSTTLLRMTFRPGLPLLAFLFAAFVSSAAADPQVVILKLDDVVAQPSAKGPVSERWQRIADYLVENRIKGSFGIICASLERTIRPTSSGSRISRRAVGSSSGCMDTT